MRLVIETEDECHSTYFEKKATHIEIQTWVDGNCVTHKVKFTEFVDLITFLGFRLKSINKLAQDKFGVPIIEEANNGR